MKCSCAVALLALLLACRSGKTETPAAKTEPAADPTPGKPVVAAPSSEHPADEHEALPSIVRLDAKVVKNAGIRTAKAGVQSLPATVDLTGELASDPDRTARLTARVPGRVLEVRAKEGARVKAGDVIAVIDSPDLARARATVASATARAQSTRLNAERLESLEAKSLASGQEVSSARAEAAALQAEVVAARQSLAALGMSGESSEATGARQTIRSPLSGFILTRDAVQGQTIAADHVIAVVGDLERAYFLGRLFEKDLAVVKPNARVEVRLNAYPHEVFEGTVETIGKQLDPAARTVTARIVVRNHGDLLKVGLFGTARVVTGPSTAQRKHVVVPLTAVTRLADKDVVFVQRPDGAFEVHNVTLGATAAGHAEVLAGLRKDEDVVVDGAFVLKSAVLKSTFGEEE
jgi:membrane fusion protein, heavy metal efflux system